MIGLGSLVFVLLLLHLTVVVVNVSALVGGIQTSTAATTTTTTPDPPPTTTTTTPDPPPPTTTTTTRTLASTNCPAQTIFNPFTKQCIPCPPLLSFINFCGCPNGHGLVDNQCWPCPTGSQSQIGYCVCSGGKNFFDQGSKTCMPCPPGTSQSVVGGPRSPQGCQCVVVGATFDLARKSCACPQGTKQSGGRCVANQRGRGQDHRRR